MINPTINHLKKVSAHVAHLVGHCSGDKYAVFSYYGTFTRAMLTLFDTWQILGVHSEFCQS